MKLHPFVGLHPRAPEGCLLHLPFRLGLLWGLAAFWVFHRRCIVRRTQEPDGSLREHYRFMYISFEIEVAGRGWRLQVGRPWRRPLRSEALSLR